MHAQMYALLQRELPARGFRFIDGQRLGSFSPASERARPEGGLSPLPLVANQGEGVPPDHSSDAGAPLFIDAAHLSRRGNRLLALLLADAILAQSSHPSLRRP
jgi:hypothetical protein